MPRLHCPNCLDVITDKPASDFCTIYCNGCKRYLYKRFEDYFILPHIGERVIFSALYRKSVNSRSPRDFEGQILNKIEQVELSNGATFSIKEPFYNIIIINHLGSPTMPYKDLPLLPVGGETISLFVDEFKIKYPLYKLRG